MCNPLYTREMATPCILFRWTDGPAGCCWTRLPVLREKREATAEPPCQTAPPLERVQPGISQPPYLLLETCLRSFIDDDLSSCATGCASHVSHDQESAKRVRAPPISRVHAPLPCPPHRFAGGEHANATPPTANAQFATSCSAPDTQNAAPVSRAIRS